MAGSVINNVQSDKMVDGIRLLRKMGMKDDAMTAIIDIFYGVMLHGYGNFVNALENSHITPEAADIAKRIADERPSSKDIADKLIQTGPTNKPFSLLDSGCKQTEIKASPKQIKDNEWLIDGIADSNHAIKQTDSIKHHDPLPLGIQVRYADRRSMPIRANPETKVCIRCNKEKPISEFPLIFKNKSKLGYRDECKECDIKSRALSGDDAAIALLYRLPSVKGFPIGEPDNFKIIWSLPKLSDAMGIRYTDLWKNMLRLVDLGYVDRKHFKNIRGYTFWVTDLGIEKLKMKGKADADSSSTGIHKAIQQVGVTAV